MKKTIWTFGIISGLVSSALMVCTVPFINRIGFDRSMYVGYTAIILSFLLVYFGIRSYRDNLCNGQVSFGKAFLVGLGITVISCVFYVATWEVLYFTIFPDFMDKYGAYMIEKAKASGATEAAIQKTAQEMAQFKEMYKNPFINFAMTFIEPFPVGLVITFLSAAVLRKKAPKQPATAAQSA